MTRLRERLLLSLAGLAMRTDLAGTLDTARSWFGATREQLEAERRTRLRDLLTDASTHVPYWSDLFARLGLSPGDFSSVEDLARLPVMDKSTVRANEKAMTRDPAVPGTEEMGSSGSTGEYATFLATPADVLWERVNNLLAFEQAGCRIGDPVLLFGVSLPRTRLKRIKDAFASTRYVHAFDGSDEVMRVSAQDLKDRRVRLVGGYASSIYLLARYIDRFERGARFENLQGAVSWGETLYPAWRETIERALRVPVINTYGAAGETGVWAFQCREAHLFHVADWSCILEVVRDGRPVAPGETGEILVTALYKRARPLIRYRIGDLAVASDALCRCGRQTHTLAEILGRVTDIVTTPSGMHISFAVFVGYFEFAPGIAQFQIVQTAIDTLDVNVVKSDRFSQEELDSILERIDRGARGELRLKVNFMDDIPATASGKRRLVISKFGFSGMPKESTIA